MVGVAVCGAGTWGQNLVRTFDTRPGARLLYVCDVNEAVRERMSRLYPDATVTAEMQALLEDSAVEAVVVGSDAPHHDRLARAAIDAGKHTFVE